MPNYCKNCNRPLDETFSFCPYCGIRLEQEQNRFCIRCGAELPAGAAFCGCCGMPVQGGPVATPGYRPENGAQDTAGQSYVNNGNVAGQGYVNNGNASGQTFVNNGNTAQNAGAIFAGTIPPEETVLAISNCRFAGGAGQFASRGNAALTNYRIIYYKHGTLKTLMPGHTVHLTKAEYETEIPYNTVRDMYWGVQEMSKFLDVEIMNGEHHRIYFVNFDKCMQVLQNVLKREIPKR